MSTLKERNSAPAVLEPLQKAAKDAGFDMMSDPLTGNLLATLAASKPGGRQKARDKVKGLRTERKDFYFRLSPQSFSL